MLNRKYYPFERNSYYFGKLLTAKDFEAEQKYFNDKRRFVNRVGGTNGIVSGLGVIRADDVSLVLQAGCALDATGREIVVPETRVVKLSTIEGYSELSTSCAYLGIQYKEQPADKVYAVMASEEGGQEQFNKIREEYTLNLMDESLVAAVKKPIDEFVTRQVIYADADVEVAQYVPKFLPFTNGLRIRVELRKLSPGTGEFSFCYELATPNFTAADGAKSISVSLSNVKLGYGQKEILSYVLTPEQHLWGGNGTVAVTASEFTLQKNGEVLQLNEKLEAQIKPVGCSVEEFYLSDYYSKSMDKVLEQTADESLWIAKLNLIRQNNQVIIDSISPAPFDQYCYNPQQLMLLRRLEEYYPEAAEKAVIAANAQMPAAPVMQDVQGGIRSTACGVFEMGIGLGHDQKKETFSSEIMHGLGKGPVYVQVGVEYITADNPGEESSEIILGDAEIFAHEDEKANADRMYNLSTAVKVLPERGTFVVGVRLGETTGLISLRIRWYAFRLNEIDKQLKPARDGEGYILINPETIVPPPKGTAHLSPVFINMPTEPCSYELVDAEGGSVDQNGVYTAPAKEGVYEIRIEAISNPKVYTHAFAIVSQKKKDDKKEEKAKGKK